MVRVKNGGLADKSGLLALVEGMWPEFSEISPHWAFNWSEKFPWNSMELDKVDDMLSRHIFSATTLLKHHFVLHETYVQQYAYFQNVHLSLSQDNHVGEFDYHLRHNFLYHLGKKDVAIDGDMEKAKKFIEQFQMVLQIAQGQLEKSQGKYKARHKKHRVEHKFQVSDEFWLHIGKDMLQGEGRKLKPI